MMLELVTLSFGGRCCAVVGVIVGGRPRVRDQEEI